MKEISRSRQGVSPVIAVILMVAITIILASVVSIWVFSFLSDDNTNNVEKFRFDVELSGSSDTITISHMKGDTLKTSMITVYLDEQVVDLPLMNLSVGGSMVAISPIDLIPGDTYHIKMVIQDELQFSRDRIAAP